VDGDGIFSLVRYYTVFDKSNKKFPVLLSVANTAEERVKGQYEDRMAFDAMYIKHPKAFTVPHYCGDLAGILKRHLDRLT
jgi:hypothetical protein